MSLMERVISVVAPHDCVMCGREGSLVCMWCMPEILERQPERCYRCKKSSTDNKTCSTCRRESRLGYVWRAGSYEGVIKQLIEQVKFHRCQAAGLILGDLLAYALPYLDPDTIITNVPTATTRRRLRGYDQTEIIARQCAMRRQLQYSPLLARLGQSRQVGSKRETRIQQMHQAFRVLRNVELSGRHILVIDDILTTGATLESAARVLRSAGASRVVGAVVAQK